MNQHNGLFLQGKNGYTQLWIGQTGYMEEKYKYFAKDVILNLSHDSYVMWGNEQKNLITCKCNEVLKKKY